MKNPNPDPAKHKAIRIWNHEDWQYEDFEVGQRSRSIRRTISEGEAWSSMPSCSTCIATSPMMYSHKKKASSDAPRRRRDGVQGASVLMAHNNIHTFSYGYDKLRFIKPVFIGDTIYTIRTNLEKRPKYPTMGMVGVSYEVFKMPGELVLYCEHLQTVKYRDASKFEEQIEKK